MNRTPTDKETITVMVDYKGTRDLRPFYCVRCGKCVCELTGDATAIIPGMPDEEGREELDLSFIARCGGTVYLGGNDRVKCTAKYIFN